MAAELNHPGVYVEEIPSGVRTITGVATSVTAFVGRASRGPVHEPVVVFGFEEFARRFGGLWRDSTLGYAVQDFFANGGGQAVVVRLADSTTTPVRFAVGGLPLVAVDPGTWGVFLRAVVDKDDTDQQVADELKVPKDSLFNLTVRESAPGGRTETFHNLSTGQNARNVASVLAAQSALVRVDGNLPGGTPSADQDRLGKAEADVGKARAGYQQGTVTKDALDAAEQALRKAVDDALAAVSDGAALTAADFLPQHGEADHTGLYALDHADLFNLLCIPPHKRENGDIEPGLVSAALAYCKKRRAVLLVDPRDDWKYPIQQPETWLAPIDGPRENAAAYFPRLRRADPEQSGRILDFAPCGAVAGVLARTDAVRGVWKAGAGLEAGLVGVPDLAVRLSDGENGLLNPLGVNCLRSFPVAGRVVWGARTLAGADVLASEWKYLPVRRLALFIEESLFRGTQWVVFEPNGEALWAQVRLNVGSFMQELFRQGALQGSSPREAYFVKCDAETTTQADRDLGVVNIRVGFAPLKPAEFVVVQVQQLSEQLPS
ncbi:phage tail sheath C-terminal domain-containing protein [Streptomyces sp. CB01881]|uniref:phage tail sheath C-terminal domain-containing protein n=1 Tax=Streptomyces sp. CB01881 TaxID=2078691 RepID=UPI000CDC9DA3|nr:phage tail sheath C-terminal domain-containing protein [Streptomyces sp. CB01881]AUY53140.1 phage tail protein [Streptomyces sp. CB01881]TYC69295.1 phage tail sheath family protein [Streptomyces sp. CB01881]